MELQDKIYELEMILDQYSRTRNVRILNKAKLLADEINLSHDFNLLSLELRLIFLLKRAYLIFELYFFTNKQHDLDQAAETIEKALSFCPESSPQYLSFLNNYGNILNYKYIRSGDIKYLSDSIEVLRKLVDMTPKDFYHFPGRLNSLANSLIDYYSATGNVSYLHESISRYEKSVKVAPKDFPYLVDFLNNFGHALTIRYEIYGKLEDIENSIKILKEATELSPHRYPEKTRCLQNLGNAIRKLFKHKKKIYILEESLNKYTEALSLMPKNANSAAALFNDYANGLSDKYDLLKNISDLKLVIKFYKKSLEITPKNDHARPSRLNNLGHALLDFYKITGNEKELDESIKLLEECDAIVPEYYFQKSDYLCNLGSALIEKYKLKKSDEALHKRAISIIKESFSIGSKERASETLKNISDWINLCFTENRLENISWSYESLVHTIHTLLKSQLIRSHKEAWLKDIQGIASKVAYAFVKLEDPQKAVESLEQGQARLLSESLALIRADDLNALQGTENEHLYNTYKRCVERWYWAQNRKQEELENIKELKNIHEQLDDIIEEIRQIPSHTEFLKSPSWEHIKTSAENNPILYVLTTEKGGLALMVHKNKITPIELLQLTEMRLHKVMQGLKKNEWGGYLGAYFRSRENEQAWHKSLEKTTHWLWKAVMFPIINALPKNAKVTLIPVGRLNLLPLHAAWTEDNTTPTGKLYALDCLTIHYAPNALALLEAQKLLEKVGSDKLLAVDEPLLSPPRPLPNSKYEIETVASTFKNPRIFRHENATHTAILNALNDYNVFHFSCHGAADFNDPLKSCLVMANNERLTLKDFLEYNLNGVRLATLSACETNISGMKLPDEVVNLSAGLMQAGVAGVCASLWSVSDLSTMMLMTYFYDLWRLKNCEPAEALRQAQIWIRDSTNDKKLDYMMLMTYFYDLWRLKKLDPTEALRQAQIWMRDTTNEEKLDYFFKAANLSKDTFERLYSLKLKGTKAKSYAHPYYWAAFGYVGV